MFPSRFSSLGHSSGYAGLYGWLAGWLFLPFKGSAHGEMIWSQIHSPESSLWLMVGVPT